MKVLAEIEGGKGGDKHKEALDPTLLHMASWVGGKCKIEQRCEANFFVPTEYKL